MGKFGLYYENFPVKSRSANLFDVWLNGAGAFFFVLIGTGHSLLTFKVKKNACLLDFLMTLIFEPSASLILKQAVIGSFFKYIP